MQRVNLFHYFANYVIPEAVSRQRHTSGDAGTAELSPCQRTTRPLYFKDSHRCSFPLIFDLSHSRAEITSMFDRVPLYLCICHGTLLFKHRCFTCPTHKAKQQLLYVFFQSPDASHLRVFTILLINLPLFSHSNASLMLTFHLKISFQASSITSRVKQGMPIVNISQLYTFIYVR